MKKGLEDPEPEGAWVKLFLKISVSVHLFSVQCSLVMAFHRRATEETSARVTVLKQVVCQAFDPVFCIADLKAYLEVHGWL